MLLRKALSVAGNNLSVTADKSVNVLDAFRLIKKASSEVKQKTVLRAPLIPIPSILTTRIALFLRDSVGV